MRQSSAVLREGLARGALPGLARSEIRFPPTGLLVISRLTDELSRRSARARRYPEGESVDYDYVTDMPWWRRDFYRGDLRSHIEVNTDIPTVPDVVVELVAHETYPGHQHGARMEKDS